MEDNFISDEKLIKIIRDICHNIYYSTIEDIEHIVKPLSDLYCILNSLKYHRSIKRKNIEWYIEVIIQIVKRKKWDAVNNWLLCIDIFAPEK